MPLHLPVLDEAVIPIPCTIPWHRMHGDNQARFCTVCSQSVHNIESLSRKEAETLLSENPDGVCVRLFRQPDGSVLTRDRHDASHARPPAIFRRLAIALLSWLGFSLMSGCGVQGKIKCSRPPQKDREIIKPDAPPHERCEEAQKL